MTLRQLRYALAVADTLHFRHAAERCGVTQPSLSAQINELETALRVRLFERGRSGVTVTPIGREVIERARRTLTEARAIADYAAGAQEGAVGLIKLGAKPTIGPYLLPHVVARLHRCHRELKLYVRESDPGELEFELMDGIHDVILAQLPLAGAELTVARLFREPLYLAMAADDPLAGEEEIDARALTGRRVLTLDRRHHLHHQVDGLCREFGATLSRDYEGTSLDALRLMVGMGMGVAFVPALYARSEIRARGEVVAKPIKRRTITRSIGLAWRRSAGSTAIYATLAEAFRATARRKFPDLIVEPIGNSDQKVRRRSIDPG
jgi:LysR family hydrogen peroxide-inducible transcriptional activator